MADEETFVSRWSRRKRDARTEAEAEPCVPESQAQQTEPAEGETSDGDPKAVAALPDIESLDETSDFTPFMAKGVPEALRRRALHKLWRLNPVFAELDGLNEYDEDFTDAAAALLGQVKTVYQVGKGMVSEPASEEEPAPEEERSLEEPAPGEERSQEEAAEDRQETAALSRSAYEQEAAVPEAPAEAAVPEAPAEPAAQAELGVEGQDAAVAKPGNGARRSAAARRWGESSE